MTTERSTYPPAPDPETVEALARGLCSAATVCGDCQRDAEKQAASPAMRTLLADTARAARQAGRLDAVEGAAPYCSRSRPCWTEDDALRASEADW